MSSPLEDTLNELAEWSAKYRNTTAYPPESGAILTAIDGLASLVVEITEGKPPFIYGKAFVPELPDIEPAWYLENDEHQFHHGWKCILMSKARSELLKRCELKDIIKANKIDKARYDIIEKNQEISEDLSIRKTYWFNRETGLLELGLGFKLNPKEDENPFYEAFVITYYDVNGIHYPKQILGYYKDFRLNREETVTELEINEVKAQ